MSSLAVLGASNHSVEEREIDDFYATDPKAVDHLLKLETFNKNIWECACGSGHISEVLKKNGYNVYSSDLVDRGYNCDIIDFLNVNYQYDGDIVTNPPYNFALEFVLHSLKVLKPGSKIAMFLKLLFLESQGRREKLFNVCPPVTVYVSSSRLVCAKSGDFKKYKTSAISYAWFIWEVGYKGKTELKWFN